MKAAGLSVMIYSGYELEELVALEEPAARVILRASDLLIAGRFVASARETELAWRGSTNQRAHFLSSRYTPADLDHDVEAEIHFDEDGAASVTGFPSRRLLATLGGRVR